MATISPPLDVEVHSLKGVDLGLAHLIGLPDLLDADDFFRLTHDRFRLWV